MTTKKGQVDAVLRTLKSEEGPLAGECGHLGSRRESRLPSVPQEGVQTCLDFSLVNPTSDGRTAGSYMGGALNHQVHGSLQQPRRADSGG